MTATTLLRRSAAILFITAAATAAEPALNSGEAQIGRAHV